MYGRGETQALNSSVTWQTSQPAIATVDAQGVVTTVARGVTDITATYEGVTGSTTLTVGSPALLSISVSPNQYFLPVDESGQLSATGSFSDGSTRDLTQWSSWSSSAPTIASVSSTGTVVAHAVGSATISVSVGAVTGSATLTVTPAVPVALAIAPASVSIVLGGSFQLQVTATMSDGSLKNMTGLVAWSSANPGLVSVSSFGLVTANQVGGTTISAAGSGLNGSVTVTVIPLMTVSYFNLTHAKESGFDDTIRLTNPGVTGGDVCAMVYVFDRNQEMNECCGCTISDSGLLTLSLINDLTSNTLTGKKPVAGVIEIVPSNLGPNGQCNAGSLAPNGAVLGWGTNVQTSQSGYQITEETFAQTTLGTTEAAVLANECGMMQTLGSGRGVCSCGSGDNQRSH
jgi:uncharacterized protein YjdB